MKDCPGTCGRLERCEVSVLLKRNVGSVVVESYLPSLLMNIINQASVYLKGNITNPRKHIKRTLYRFILGDSKFDLIITVNITIMMVLASIYLSISTSLPSTPNIKPVELWLIFNLAYPFFLLVFNVALQVNFNI